MNNTDIIINKIIELNDFYENEFICEEDKILKIIKYLNLIFKVDIESINNNLNKYYEIFINENVNQELIKSKINEYINNQQQDLQNENNEEIQNENNEEIQNENNEEIQNENNEEIQNAQTQIINLNDIFNSVLYNFIANHNIVINTTNILEFNNELNNNQDVPIILKKDEIKKLKSCTFNDLQSVEKKSNKYCPITQEEFINNDDIIILPCNHIFKKTSIIEWLENHSHKCPVCRNSAGISSPKID